MAAVLGMISGVGGGMTRDVLAREVPFVLREDLYAIAALVAGAIVSVGSVRDCRRSDRCCLAPRCAFSANDGDFLRLAGATRPLGRKFGGR